MDCFGVFEKKKNILIAFIGGKQTLPNTSSFEPARKKLEETRWFILVHFLFPFAQLENVHLPDLTTEITGIL